MNLTIVKNLDCKENTQKTNNEFFEYLFYEDTLSAR